MKTVAYLIVSILNTLALTAFAAVAQIKAENFSELPANVGATNGSGFTLAPGASVVLVDWSGPFHVWDTNGVIADIDTEASPFSTEHECRAVVTIGSDSGTRAAFVSAERTPFSWLQQAMIWFVSIAAPLKFGLFLARRLKTTTVEAA